MNLMPEHIIVGACIGWLIAFTALVFKQGAVSLKSFVVEPLIWGIAGAMVAYLIGYFS